MGNFGSRLFFLSLRSPDTDNDELIALNRGKDRKLKENECRKITENFLRTLWSANPLGVDWNKEKILIIASSNRALRLSVGIASRRDKCVPTRHRIR